ncbi:MAG: hypothetical protein ACREVZ_01580 [Burkholderiales bacterium]
MRIGGYDYISEREFDISWGARAKSNGDLFSYDEVKSLPTELVWTVSEREEPDEDGFSLDNSWIASPGFHVVNVLGYLITAKPWTDGTPDAIWYLDNDDYAREDRRQTFRAQLPDAATD